MKRFFFNARLADAEFDTVVSSGAILVIDGKIQKVFKSLSKDEVSSIMKAENLSKEELCDCDEKTLLPAFVDMHSHFRDPGQCHKETLETGIKAAIAGGYSTVVLMPNTSPVISSVEQVQEIYKRIAEIEKNVLKHSVPQIFQSVSLTKNFDGKTTEHLEAIDKALIPLVTEDGKDVQDASVFLEVLQHCAKKDVLVSCHCEDASFSAKAKLLRTEGLAHPEKKRESFLQAEQLLRNAEDLFTYRNLYLANQIKNARIHIAHISTQESLTSLQKFKSKCLDYVSAEVTPHHFSLDWNNLEIVNPPLRSQKDIDAILSALANDLIDVIATDHAPHTMDEKATGTPGFTGLETAFSVANQFLVKPQVLSLSHLSKKLSLRPCQLLGISDRGLLKENYQADFAIVDLNKTWAVDTLQFFSKGKYSPFSKQNLTGKVIETFIKGICVYNANQI